MKSEQKEEDSIRYTRGMPYPSCSKDYKGEKMKYEKLESEAEDYAKAKVKQIFDDVYGNKYKSFFTTDSVKRSYDDRDLKQTIKDAYKSGAMRKSDKMKGEIKGRISVIDIIWYEARRECINEVKKMIADAIKKAEKDNAIYEDFIEAEALDIIKEKINNMK